jgi:outer membrane protein OmpA-like peptidoglycan-associated protein
MNKSLMNISKTLITAIALFVTSISSAQVISKLSLEQRHLLLRDSMDYKYKKLPINTKHNEFSPNLLQGGVLYISNKPNPKRRELLNRIYWTKDSNYTIGDTITKITAKQAKLNKRRTRGVDEFTTATSNDNNILIHFKKDRNLNRIEQQFVRFTTDQAFAYDDSAQLIVYAKKTNRLFTHNQYWRLWQAYVINGHLVHKRRLFFGNKKADYLYPFIDVQNGRLYLASNKPGGKGGFDIYYANKEGDTYAQNLTPLDIVNTNADELAPFVVNNKTYFSSTRAGSLGGFDVFVLDANKNEAVNMGYPINSDRDDISLKTWGKDYFLTTNRTDDFNILGLQYEPVFYPIKGTLIYKSDSTLVPNHGLLLKDGDTGERIDSLVTDANAKYAFTGKPNRNYVFTTLNGDTVLEQHSIQTYANQTKFDYITAIGGRSPKQRADSLAALWALEQKRLDSLAQYGLATKFIVRYGFNKSNIVAKEQVVLDSLLIKLNKMPNTYIVVGAFTDCIGSYKYNYQLSVKRAKSVVAYLTKHGLDKKRIVTNGYSKKYNVTPCITKYGKRNQALQQNSRRAEIVLSENKNTNWEKLEKARGKGYYQVYDASGKLPANKLGAITARPTIKPVAKTVVKDTVAKPVVVKEQAKAVVNKQKDSIKVDTKPAVKTTAVKPVVKVETPKPVAVVEKPKVEVKKEEPKVIVATPSTVKEDDDMSKEEIVKALDSLAKLKKEQERIVEYLTKRINKKPIDVFVTGDSVTVEIYDNGIHDKDSVSVIYNNRIIVDRQELKVNMPIKFKLKVDKNKKNNELVMVAENLGSEPPNTAVMFITEKSGRRQQVMLSTDMTHNEVVYFIRIGKE